MASVGITVSNAVAHAPSRQATNGVWPRLENAMLGFLNICARFTPVFFPSLSLRLLLSAST